MRYPLPVLILGAALAGCAGASSPAPKPTATTGTVAHLESVPVTTPPSIKGRHHLVPPAAHSSPAPTSRAITPLPTPRGITFVTPTPFPASAYRAALQGIVVDAKSHSPLAGALVTVGAHHVTRSTASGRYYVTFPTGADVAVEVTKRGFASSLAMGSISPHRTLTLNFALTPIARTHPLAPAPPAFFGHH